ncbi:hypothetical protein KKH23_00970 [Patescibacteria group bacterium]|nr:hypothetical protein [Patescibacteria group bacterium]MBU0777064.1 hypothetical protein [Patescibacteria group bacterium]MBU0845758.1 hypothetical protein [Patescibacteria group bacterium]MBU0923192.1 hypothetical protein [Patescibacteria group bacterium]MBU1066482.1 hypothetical protein [Patescibacteria group bacterium]
MKTADRKKVLAHLFEFFVLGVCMGVVEDIIAIHFATDTIITLQTFKVAVLVAVPFAIIAEILVDLKVFRKVFFKNEQTR